jgi:hypothetical protein
MKSSSISVSNSMILSLREWIITAVLTIGICGAIYYGWNSWEKFTPCADYRETCWAEKQSDYWAYNRWMKYARSHYKVLLIGDSVIWGQEVPINGTITHYLNESYGKEIFANLGNDGLFMAGIDGIVKYYGENLNGANVLLQLSPLWMSSPTRDLRAPKKSNYHHPRLLPLLDRRITYYHDFNTRLDYFFERYFRIFPFVRHLTAVYYDNMSVSAWMMANPYKNPFSAITFQSTPVMADSQGTDESWNKKDTKLMDSPFVNPSESVQWGFYKDALSRLEKKNSKVFVMIGPFNQYMLTPESRVRLFDMVDKIKKELDSMGVPYFDTFQVGIESNMFADTCHVLRQGHILIGQKMIADPKFREWIGSVDR